MTEPDLKELFDLYKDIEIYCNEDELEMFKKSDKKYLLETMRMCKVTYRNYNYNRFEDFYRWLINNNHKDKAKFLEVVEHILQNYYKRNTDIDFDAWIKQFKVNGVNECNMKN